MNEINTGKHRAYASRLVAVVFFTLGASISAQTNNEPIPADAAPGGENTQPQNTVKTVPDIAGKKADLLVTQLQDKAIRWHENEHGRFPVIWEQEGSGTPFGALLFIHGPGQTLDLPHSINTLRSYLVEHGWSSLSISMPDLDPQSIPERPTESANAEQEQKPAQSSPKNSPQPRNNISNETIANSRIKSAIDFLQSKGQFNIIIIAYGASAVRAANYIGSIPKKRKTKTAMQANAKAVIERPIRALVIVDAIDTDATRTDARRVDDIADKTLPASLNDPGLPVLDVYFGNHYIDKKAASTRRQSAQREQMKSYEQVRMLEPSIEIAESNRLARRVRGFLNKYAKGVKISQ